SAAAARYRPAEPSCAARSTRRSSPRATSSQPAKSRHNSAGMNLRAPATTPSMVAPMQVGAGRGPAAVSAAAAAAALGVLLAVALPRYALSAHALAGLGTLSLLAAWTGLSATWSPAPDTALAD